MSGFRIARNVTVFALTLSLAGLVGCKPSGSGTTIQNKGSDTMIEVAQAWSEAYTDASVEISGGGSGVGVSALINGTVDIANASRPMKDREIADAKKKHPRKDPQEHVVGYDALAIYVHKDNPLEEITMDQLKAVYGEGGDSTQWSDLGVKVPGCDNDEIVLLSRQNNSGTYEYLKEAVLGKYGKYKLTTIDASGSKDLVKRLGNTPCGIGYSGMGYKTDEVKFLKVAKGGASGVLPSVAAVHDGSYPIARPLRMYTLGLPTGAIKAYLDWVRSDGGQTILEKIGYVPLPADERVKPAPTPEGKGSEAKEAPAQGSEGKK